MNKKAAFFSSMFVATLAFLSSIYVFFAYEPKAAIIPLIAAFAWIGIGFFFKRTNS